MRFLVYLHAIARNHWSMILGVSSKDGEL